MRLWNNEPLSRHTSFQIGGPADVLAMPESESEWIELLNERPRLVLGAGTNVLAPDEGVRGLVALMGPGLAEIRVEGQEIYAQAGAKLPAVALAAARAGLSGLEFAGGIPGSVGGAAAMNAGAYGGEIARVLTEARVILGGEVKSLSNEEMRYGYRASMPLKTGAVVTAARFRLTRDDPQAIFARMAELNARRREKQPLQMPSAGSVFKRPEGHFAGALIEGAGLKGRQIGGARVSELHAGFIVNAGGATAADVRALIALIKREVYARCGVMLEEEVRVL